MLQEVKKEKKKTRVKRGQTESGEQSQLNKQTRTERDEQLRNVNKNCVELKSCNYSHKPQQLIKSEIVGI